MKEDRMVLDGGCYEDFSSFPSRSNHPWTDENYMYPETAECKRCGRKMSEWLADIQQAMSMKKDREYLGAGS